MILWNAGAWGLAGGAAVGVASLMTAIVKAGFTWPWKDHPEQIGPRLCVFVCGLILGCLVSTAMHSSFNDGWPAFALGVTALPSLQGLLAGVEIAEKPDKNEQTQRIVPLKAEALAFPDQVIQQEEAGDGNR